MKKIFNLALILGTITLISCEKENKNDDPINFEKEYTELYAIGGAVNKWDSMDPEPMKLESKDNFVIEVPGTAWRMMPSYFRTKALLTLTSPIWWNCTSPRNQTPKPPRKHSNGCISQSVMQNGHCWATTIKSKGNTYSCISTSLFTN